MLVDTARHLDSWVVAENVRRRHEGSLQLKPCEIRVFGQSALLEHGVPLSLAATRDVDARANYEYAVESQFRKLLEARGRVLDPVGHEGWMPRETRWLPVFEGEFVRLLLAEPEAVLLSKGLKAPIKNRNLLLEYLALGPSDRFLELAATYELDLEQFL